MGSSKQEGEYALERRKEKVDKARSVVRWGGGGGESVRIYTFLGNLSQSVDGILSTLEQFFMT